jgi:hypothetical protein
MVTADTQTGSVPAWPDGEGATPAPAVPDGAGPSRYATALPAAGHAEAVGPYFSGAIPAGSCTVSWWLPLASGWPDTDLVAGAGNGDQIFTR